MFVVNMSLSFSHLKDDYLAPRNELIWKIGKWNVLKMRYVHLSSGILVRVLGPLGRLSSSVLTVLASCCVAVFWVRVQVLGDVLRKQVRTGWVSIIR